MTLEMCNSVKDKGRAAKKIISFVTPYSTNRGEINEIGPEQSSELARKKSMTNEYIRGKLPFFFLSFLLVFKCFLINTMSVQCVYDNGRTLIFFTFHLKAKAASIGFIELSLQRLP